MDNGSDNKMTLSLEERINGVVHDGPDLVQKLSKLAVADDAPIEIVTELPAATDLDIILGYVMRWWKYSDCSTRICGYMHGVIRHRLRSTY